MSKLPCGRPTPARSGAPSRARLGKDWKARLSAYLRAHDLKQSKSRDCIVETLLKEAMLGEPGHFSTQGLVKKVQAEHPEIGAATIYRNLPVLMGSGLIQESLTDEVGQKIYEVALSEEESGHHDHIVCLDCDRIFEFHEEVIEQAQDKVSRKMGFSPVEHRHVIYARCSYGSRGDSRGGRS